MKIVSGKARGINLDVPRGESVRPTSIRAKKALFDSLGNFNNLTIIDLFAGSGALGLEAASRGATDILFIEQSNKHCHFIDKNIQKILKAGAEFNFKTVNRDVATIDFSRFNIENASFIFADPPYEVSGELFKTLTNSPLFATLPKQATLIWELPDNKWNRLPFLKTGNWKRINQRSFGGTEFMYLQQKES